MAEVYLSLGSNLGDRAGFIRKALDEFLKTGSLILKKSSLYETEPVGKKNQPWFLNCCVGIETDLAAGGFLNECQRIEDKLGRVRKGAWAPRTIDIDIIFFDSRIINQPSLKIPHPKAHERRFVLAPLAEIAPDFIHPVLKKSVGGLLAECRDESVVRPYASCNLTHMR